MSLYLDASVMSKSEAELPPLFFDYYLKGPDDICTIDREHKLVDANESRVRSISYTCAEYFPHI